LDWLSDAIEKSLLLLFFRKEVLSCLFPFSPYLGGYEKDVSPTPSATDQCGSVEVLSVVVVVVVGGGGGGAMVVVVFVSSATPLLSR